MESLIYTLEGGRNRERRRKDRNNEYTRYIENGRIWKDLL